MKENKMQIRTEEVEGTEYLIAETEGDDGQVMIHQIDLRALSSGGILLGLTDPAEVATKILRFKEKKVAKGEPNVWTPLYDALNEGLDQLSKAGVPAEYMEELLTMDAPVPTAEATEAIIAAREEGLAIIDEDPDVVGDAMEDVVAALDGHEEKIAEMRLNFVDTLAPVYEIPPALPPQSVPEAMDVLNGITPPVNSLMQDPPTA